MKLKVQHVMDATLVISQIIRDRRQMPQKGKYRLARMHAKLLPEFTTINDQRDAMIKAYDFETKVTVKDEAGVESEVSTNPPSYSVPLDKMPEFTAAWKEIGDGEIDVDVEPIPLAYLDLGEGVDGCVEASELITLGDLVRE